MICLEVHLAEAVGRLGSLQAVAQRGALLREDLDVPAASVELTWLDEVALGGARDGAAEEGEPRAGPEDRPERAMVRLGVS